MFFWLTNWHRLGLQPLLGRHEQFCPTFVGVVRCKSFTAVGAFLNMHTRFGDASDPLAWFGRICQYSCACLAQSDYTAVALQSPCIATPAHSSMSLQAIALNRLRVGWCVCFGSCCRGAGYCCKGHQSYRITLDGQCSEEAVQSS
jgi:hypothetical protein